MSGIEAVVVANRGRRQLVEEKQFNRIGFGDSERLLIKHLDNDIIVMQQWSCFRYEFVSEAIGAREVKESDIPIVFL